MANAGSDLTDQEAERVRAAILELLAEHENNKSEVGRILGITSQAIGKQTRAQAPENPGLDTARKVARHRGMQVWQLLWPESAGGPAAPSSPTNFEIAAEVARREGFAAEAIERVRGLATNREDERSPLDWVRRIEFEDGEIDPARTSKRSTTRTKTQTSAGFAEQMKQKPAEARKPGVR